MPKGVYTRKKKHQVAKEIKQLKKDKKAVQHKLTMRVYSYQEGFTMDVFQPRNLFQALEILVNNYLLNGIVIEEIRIV